MKGKKGKIILVGAEDEENLAIRYLGAELQNKGHEVRIIPCSNPIHYPHVLKELKSFKPDMVAVSMAFQSMATMFLELIHQIKETMPHVHVTVGGHFPTFEYKKILEYETIDTVIRFEGEKPISKLINCIINDESLQKVPNLAYKSSEDDSIKETFITNDFGDLDSLSFPLRNKNPHDRLGEHFATLVTSRGCFHSKCIYCCIGAFHQQKKGLPYSLRTPENVSKEMGHLYHKKKVRLFQFHDDNFLLPSKKESYERLKLFKKSLIEKGMDLNNIALLIKTRPDGIDEDILNILDEIGTVGVFLGVENASNNGLKALARSSNRDEIDHSLQLLEDFDMAVTFNLLIFHPRTTLEEINENIYFMNKNAHMAFDFGRAEIVAGSPLEKLVRHRGLLKGTWPQWDYQIEDDAVEKMFRIIALTFYQENSPYTDLSHKLIAISYRSQLLQRFYPGKKSKQLKKESMKLIKDSNRFTLDSLLSVYSLVAESDIENSINTLCGKMNSFYGDSAEMVDELSGKMWRFQMIEKKFMNRGVDDYFQNSETLGKLFRI